MRGEGDCSEEKEGDWRRDEKEGKGEEGRGDEGEGHSKDVLEVYIPRYRANAEMHL